MKSSLLKAHILLSVCKLNIAMCVLSTLQKPHGFHKVVQPSVNYVGVLTWFFFNNKLLSCYFTHNSESKFLKLIYLSFYTKFSEMSSINEFAIN